MGKEKIGAQDVQEVAIAGPRPGEHGGAAVEGWQEVACWETGPDGKPRQVWHEKIKNVVCQQGLAMMGNFCLGSQRATSDGPFLVLHQANAAASNSSYVWSQLSSLHPADSMYAHSGTDGNLYRLTMASTNATASEWNATTALTFDTNTTTISGAALIFYSTTTCSTAPANSADVKLFNMGSFTAAQAVQSGNTLSVSISIKVSTS
jgi:hypothetical protein